MGTIDFPGIALVIGALGLFVTTIVTAVVNLRATRAGTAATKAVHAEVVTLNDKTAGQLLADTETRRVEGISHDDRTALEQKHLDESAPVDPPQGPAR